MSFKDHFSGHAADYAEARPDYPEALFAFLAALCDEHARAWDCATGNGQAAIGLSKFFAQVIATDASAEQIAAAKQHPGVDYRVMPAERADLPSHAFDLVTVAQALHWFDQPKFFATCERVLKPSGMLAVWCYGQCTVNAAVDAVVGRLYGETLDAWWPPERKQVEEQYGSVEFPFTRVRNPPDFSLSLRWTADQFLAYLRSWSATQRYIAEQGTDPVAEIEQSVRQGWGASLEKAVQWPLTLVVCRK